MQQLWVRGQCPREVGAAWYPSCSPVTCLPVETAAGSRCPASSNSSGSTSSERFPTSGVSWNIYPFPHAIRSRPELSNIRRGQGEGAWGWRSCDGPTLGGLVAAPAPLPARSAIKRWLCNGGGRERVIFGELLVNVSRSCCLLTAPAASSGRPAVSPAL